LGDASFQPPPLSYFKAAIGSELHRSPWRSQVEVWLKNREVSLVQFEARAVRRGAKPVDRNKDMYAVVNPIAPLLVLGVESLFAELVRPRDAELDVAVMVGTQRFQASAVSRLSSSDLESAFASVMAQVAQELAHRLAEEAAGLSPTPRSTPR
jgi:hypothetical protein